MQIKIYTVTDGNWDFLWIDKISFLLYEQQEFGMHGSGFNHRKLAPRMVDLIKKWGCHTQRKLGCHCSTITKAMDISPIPPSGLVTYDGQVQTGLRHRATIPSMGSQNEQITFWTSGIFIHETIWILTPFH